jgi:hypothetical protein
MGEVARAATARHCALNTNISYTPSALIHVMTAKNLTFPIIAKPNLGLCGFGVRLIANVNELETYLKDFPMGEAVVLQEYLSAEGEAGIFYARHPHEDKGQIIGLTLRHYPRVIGDGKKTIAQLIAANPRAQRLLLARHHQCSHLSDSIPTKEHVVRLATIGSTRVGGLYEDGAAYITPALTHAIDAIARDMPHFYFGRFDVRFASLEEISKGQHFKIMEINGAGSEAIQAWDPNTSLWTAFSIIFAKQRLLFTIGAANRAKGYQPISLRQLAALHFRQRGLIENYPPSN